MVNYLNIFQQIRFNSENEVVEFKLAEHNFDFDELGKYFSALSNEANLHQKAYAWLVFGVQDKSRDIIGTSYKNSEQAINKLKQDISQHTTDNLTFHEIISLIIENKRVLLFQIPAAPRNIVIHWKGIAYGRNGESCVPLNQTKRDIIRNQLPQEDWSAQLVKDVSLADLDDMAMAKARIMFKRVHENKITAEEIDSWSCEDFLGHCGIYRDGQLTRAAILLLGKPDIAYKIAPAVAQISWSLQDEENEIIDYEHFTIPFIITVDNVLSKIRNLTMREMPGGTLFPETIKQYDDYTIREALHNCIVHQDYTLQQRIVFVENPTSLYYCNGGTFIPGSIENALTQKGPQRYYRNKCLCEAMLHFNMIDTIGRGIKKMFHEQRKRYFPMPDYIIDNEKQEVSVVIYGKMLDEKYTTLLKTDHSLTMHDCILLDAVQKHHPLPNESIEYLRQKRLIEGRAPNYTISLYVARQTHQLGVYTKEKGLPSEQLRSMILQLARNAGEDGFKRQDAYEAIANILPANKSVKQKLRIVGQLLESLAINNQIEAFGKRWRIKIT